MTNREMVNDCVSWALKSKLLRGCYEAGFSNGIGAKKKRAVEGYFQNMGYVHIVANGKNVSARARDSELQEAHEKL